MSLDVNEHTASELMSFTPFRPEKSKEKKKERKEEKKLCKRRHNWNNNFILLFANKHDFVWHLKCTCWDFMKPTLFSSSLLHKDSQVKINIWCFYFQGILWPVCNVAICADADREIVTIVKEAFPLFWKIESNFGWIEASFMNICDQINLTEKKSFRFNLLAFWTHNEPIQSVESTLCFESTFKLIRYSNRLTASK